MGRPLGGNKLANAQLNRLKKTSVNKAAKPTKITIDTEETDFRCSSCGKKYKSQLGNFSASSSILYMGNNGYIDVCKTCLDKYYVQLVNYFEGNEEKAIERCCQRFDWYYSDEAAAMTSKSLSDGTTRIRLYPSKMSMSQIKRKGTTYLDTIAERASEGRIEKVEDFQSVIDEEKDKAENTQISKSTIDFFGFGYKPEEYIFLQQQYDDWADRCEIKSKVQEELFKNICVTQLMCQQAKQKQNIKEYTDGMKTFQDLLASANIKPSQNSGNALVEANTFGTLIKKWEDEKPIPEPDEDFKDIDNIFKYISTFFYGHFAKMMDIDNDFSELYKDEIGKYTVTRQEYVDDDIFSNNDGEDDDESE